MICEYAIEPELVARLHDRKFLPPFQDNFGFKSRRFISGYPKNWKKLVWQAFEKCPESENQLARTKMTELIQSLWSNSIRRKSTFLEIEDWLLRAEAEHGERPFRAILARGNPRRKDFVLCLDDLLDGSLNLWNTPDGGPTPRSAIEIANALCPIVRLCRKMVLVDPYFDPQKPKFIEPLNEILASCRHNVCMDGLAAVELHTSIDRVFWGNEVGNNRDLKEEARACQTLVANCQRLLPARVPDGMILRVVIWKRRPKGEKLHNRYLLTDIFSVMLGTGIDRAENGDSQETDDITPLLEKQHLARLQQYTGSPPAFDLVCDPFDIHGCRKR